MSEPAPSPSPAPAPAPAPTPAPEPAALARPDFLPEQFWDATSGLKTEDFGKHYVETAAAAAKAAERAAAVPPNPEGYKVEVKLPEGVKVPDGIKFDPAKDPRTPALLKTAHELGLTNADVNRLVALDAQFQIENRVAEEARIAEETKKLGDNAKARIDAATSWLNAQTGDGKTFTADEASEIRLMVGSAAGVSALEKLMAKANGTVPGHIPTPPPAPAPKTHADRIWPGGFSSTPQQKVG